MAPNSADPLSRQGQRAKRQDTPWDTPMELGTYSSIIAIQERSLFFLCTKYFHLHQVNWVGWGHHPPKDEETEAQRETSDLSNT